MHVLDGAVQAEAAGRGMAMRGIAREEHASDAEAVGHDAFERPAAESVDFDRMVAGSRAPPHVGFDARVVERARIVEL